MSFAKILASAAAASLAVSPVMAASTNPAADLSLAPALKSLRASGPSAKKSKIAQAGVIAIVVIAVGGAIGGIVAGTSSSR
jgi:hypothetical protein